VFGAEANPGGTALYRSTGEPEPMMSFKQLCFLPEGIR
jgi:hypothetical protein